MSIIDDAGEAAATIDDAGDQELVLRSRSGDRAAFAELWRRHYRAGISVARSMTSSLDADDLVQEAYARIYQSILRGGGPTGSFRAYLFTSIRNTAAGWGRARKETTTDDLETLEDPASSDRATEDALDRSVTVRAFRSLPSRWQEALWYSEIEGMKPAEVAPLLGMKPTAVAQLTFRAREGLREAWIQAHLKDVANGSDCQWTIERLGAFARSNLSRRDQGRAEAHLAECTRCSIVASEAKDVSRRLTLVLLPLTIGVTGTAAYLATVQGGGSSLAALAAIPSGVVHGTIAAHGGTGLAVAGTGLGATGSGVATAGVAGTAAAAGTVAAAATAGTAVTVAATGGGLLSAIGGMIGVVVAGAVLVGSAASGIALPPANAIAPAPTDASADLVTTDIDAGETDAAAPSAADGSGSSDSAGPDPASAADTTEATSTDDADDARTGPNAARANPASSATGAANGAVKGSLTPDPGATGIANANGNTNGTGPGTANGKANGSTNGTGPGTANGSANAAGAAAGGNANGSANGTGTANGTGIATGSANGTGPGTANGNANGNANGAGNGPGAAALPTGAPTFSATTSTADHGGLTISLAIAGTQGATVEVLLNGSVKDRVILDASGAGSSTLHLSRGLVAGDAHLQLRYAAGNLSGPAVEVPVSELAPAAG